MIREHQHEVLGDEAADLGELVGGDGAQIDPGDDGTEMAGGGRDAHLLSLVPQPSPSET